MAVVIPIVSTFDSKGVSSAMTQLKNLVDSNKSRSEKLKIGSQIAGAGILAGAGAAAVGLFQIGESFDQAFDKIRINTGATGPQLDALQSTMKKVSTDVPASFDDAASAVSTFSTKLGLSGQPLQTMSDQVLELSRMTGTDLQTNLDSVAGVMNNFGIKASDQSGKLDELFRASQKSGVSVADLASQMSTSGVQMRAVGLDFDQSAALLGTLGKAGLDVGDVMPALGKTMAVAAKNGQDAGAVFKNTFDAIKKAPNDTAAAQAAMDVFGAKAGPKLAGMIREGKLSYGDLMNTMKGGKDTIMKASGDSQDFGEKWQKIKNKVLVGLQPIASKVFDAVGKAMEKIGPIVDKVIGFFTKHKEALIAVGIILGGALVAAIVALTASLIPAAVAVFAFAWPFLAVAAAVALLVLGIMYAWKHFAWFRTIVKVVWDAIKLYIKIAWMEIKIVFNAIKWVIFNIIVPAFKHLWGFIKVVWDGISGAISFAWNAIKTVFGWISDGVSGVISIFSTIGDKIGGALGGIADLISKPFKAAFNFIADIWNNTIGKLHFTIPSWVPFIGGKEFNVPDIPKFANGGIFHADGPGGAGYAMLHDGELVLNRKQQAALFSGKSMGGDIHVHVNSTNASPYEIGREMLWARRVAG